MFTNPLNRKYQTGGSVDDEGFYSWLKTNVKEFKDYSIDQIKEGVRKMEQTEEGKKASASLKKSYEEYKKSKSSAKSKFADGGKFQDFICKHKRGGNVDCGCGGMVIRGEDGMQTPQNRYSGWQKQARRWVTLPDGSTQAVEVIVSPDGQTGIQRIITDRSQMQDRSGMAVRDTAYGGGAYDNGKVLIDASQPLIPQEVKDLNDYLDSKPQSKQDGGELTRRQALTGAQWAMGRGISPVSRDTARLAYINAKNALRNNSDLRGRDLRQAAREMISRPPQAPVPEMAQIDFNTLNNGTVLSPIKDPQFIEEPIFTDEELNQMGNQAVNDATSSLSRNTRNRGNNAIAGAVQHFATIAPSTIGAVNYGGYDTGKFGERVGNYLKAHSTELMAHPIYGTIKGLYNWFKKEDGGVIKGLDGLHLSRKQARELSGLNKGYNRGQFQLAMANADTALRNNTDLRGRELRQAKRIMVSGITPMERTVTMESSPAELEISLPTAETISNLNPNLELPVRKVVTPTRTRKSSRAAKVLDNTATTSPSIVINYEGYRNPVQNFRDMWNHFTGLFKKEDGGRIEKHQQDDKGTGIIGADNWKQYLNFPHIRENKDTVGTLVAGREFPTGNFRYSGNYVFGDDGRRFTIYDNSSKETLNTLVNQDWMNNNKVRKHLLKNVKVMPNNYFDDLLQKIDFKHASHDLK